MATLSKNINISISGNSAGKVTIGTEAVGYSLKVFGNDNIDKTNNISILSCKHIFHSNCISKWCREKHKSEI